MYDSVRERFANGDISVNYAPELISQLAYATRGCTSRGQLLLGSKDHIRTTDRRRPHKADALTLAFATPTPPKPKFRIWSL